MPLKACIKCYRVWTSRQMNFSIIDLENLKHHNRMYIVCDDCSHNRKEESVLYRDDKFEEI